MTHDPRRKIRGSGIDVFDSPGSSIAARAIGPRPCAVSQGTTHPEPETVGVKLNPLVATRIIH
jgi:hypothetical protein